MKAIHLTKFDVVAVAALVVMWVAALMFINAVGTPQGAVEGRAVAKDDVQLRVLPPSELGGHTPLNTAWARTVRAAHSTHGATVMHGRRAEYRSGGNRH